MPAMNMKINYSILLGVAALSVIAYVMFFRPAPAISAEGQPFLGGANASVVVEEFSDFQCPACGFAEGIGKRLVDSYGDKVKFVYINFPLRQIHENAEVSAEAAECAFEQGKFWQYHDLLFQNQNALDRVSLSAYAEQAGLDVARFDQCLDSGKYASAVERDFQSGRGRGVDGTPTFFINGKKLALAYEQGWDRETFVEENVGRMAQAIDGLLRS
jgi:protein-disulfide isomerase